MTISPNDKSYVLYGIYVSISNVGERSTNVYDYQLEIEYKYDKLLVERIMITEDADVSSFNFLELDNMRDHFLFRNRFQKILKPGEQQSGIVLFATPYTHHIKRQPISYKLIIRDVFGKKHTLKQKVNLLTIGEPGFFQLSGAQPTSKIFRGMN